MDAHFNTPCIFRELSATDTPESGKVIVYAKTGGGFYSKDSSGTETDLAGGGGGGSDVSTLSGNWQGTYSTVQANSSTWNSGGALPSGASGDLLFNNGSDWTATRVLSSGEITASDPLVYSQTWNDAGVTFVGKSNEITLSAANTGSVIERWKENGDRIAEIKGDGYGQVIVGTERGFYGASAVQIATDYNSAAINFSVTEGSVPSFTTHGIRATGGYLLTFKCATSDAFALAGNGAFVGNAGFFGFATNSAPSYSADVLLARGDAEVLRLGSNIYSSAAGCAIQSTEITPPGTPPTNAYRIYAEEGNSGMTRLVAKWQDGTTSILGMQGAPSLNSGPTNAWIPASFMIPKTTSGCGVNSSETPDNDQNYDTLDFDQATAEYADFMVVMPDNYDLGSVQARFYWTADEGAGTANWNIKGVAYSDGSPLSSASGTPQSVTDTLSLSGARHQVSSLTSAVTIAGTLSAGHPIQFTVYRDPASDTLNADARLLGVELVYNGGQQSSRDYYGIRADASEFIPRTLSGCGVDSQETTTYAINRDFLTFDSALKEYAQFWFNWPSGWNTAQVKFTWTTTVSAGSAVWGAAMRIFADGDSTDLAVGTAQEVTDAAATANTVRTTSSTPAITPAGTVSVGARTVLEIYRDPNNGSDDLAVDALLEGVFIERAS